jgi:hypothetical protein
MDEVERIKKKEEGRDAQTGKRERHAISSY